MTQSPFQPGRLTIVSSDRPGVLIERLAADLSDPPLSPFEEEVVVVQSLGTERWVRHELARSHGCAASIRFPFPAAFCHHLASLGDAAGAEARAIDDRFGREMLTWRILQLLECGVADGRDFEPLRRFVAEGDTRKRLGLAARIAGRFDDYQLYRPDVLMAWERGERASYDTPHGDWQAALWRMLCAGDEPPLHLARWFTEAVKSLDARTGAPRGLPRRITVFGVSTLPPIFIHLLRAAARFVPVSVYVLAPPRATWTSDVDADASGRRADLPRVKNPLFAAFGHATRELIDLLVTGGAEWEEHHAPPAATQPMHCLRQLQDDLRSGLARGPEVGLLAPVPLVPGDDSLSLHLCHSPMREMEVLRDQLLAAFAADSTLRPHDVLVLVPDVAVYAPCVETVFGVGEAELPRIPHRIADRPIAHESSLADAALRILRLVGARWTAAEVVELLDLPAVRRAAGIGDGAAERIVGWVEETRIRWGRDGAMRKESFGLPSVDANSWQSGLDRLLMGYAVGPEEGLVADVLPCAGHTIGDPDTLGAFARWVGRLFDTLSEWRTPRTLAAWSTALRDAFASFLEPDDEAEEQAFEYLVGAIDGLGRIETRAGCDHALDVAVVRDWLEQVLGDDSFGTGFLSGGMTVCALKPMRAIPFRVIAVAGLDDAAFPRRDRRAVYDLLDIAPRRGDRNLRADDRQLFLDTILSAGDRLILSCVGRSAKDNKARATSVVIAELLDLVDRGFVNEILGDDGKPLRARDAIVVEHRLQPFSPAYYDGTPATSPRLFSYSRVNARATAVAAADRRPPAPFVSGPLPGMAANARLDVALADLVGCWTNPSRFFCQHVLGLRLPGEESPLDDCEPMSVDELTRYGVGEEILRRHLAGERTPARERARAIALGNLPSGNLAGLWFDQLDEELAEFLRRVGRRSFDEPVGLYVTRSGWTLAGRIDGITGDGRFQARPTKCKKKDLIRAWITHLALSATRGPVHTTVISTDDRVVFAPVESALAELEALVAGYRATLREPIPVFEQASAAYAERLLYPSSRATLTPLEMARSKFRSSDFDSGPKADEADPYVALCWRGRDPFVGDGEFERWSETLWRPALASMKKSQAEVPA